MSDFKPDLKAQLMQAIEEQPSPTREQVQKRAGWVLAMGFFMAVVIFFLAGGFRKLGAPRPLSLTLGTAMATGAMALASFYMLVSPHRKMLERPKQLLLVVCLGVPLVFFLWKLLYSSLFLGGIAHWPTRFGNKCMMLTLTCGGSLLAAYCWLWRGSAMAHPRLTGMALGIASGIGAAVLVELWCPVGHPFHVAYGHLMPILGLGAIGGLICARYLRLQALAVQS